MIWGRVHRSGAGSEKRASDGTRRVSQTHARGIMTITTGTPIAIHRTNPKGSVDVGSVSIAPMKITFGGVPMSVPIPPTDAA